MDLRELHSFVAVVEEGGFSAAARRLHVSQPALSQTVSALERELRVKLLVRSSTGVRPTDAGAALLGEARAMLARRDQALRTMARYTGGGGGVLRIGIPLEFPSRLLGPALTELAEACPDTRVQARHLSTSEQLAALHAGELELGLLRERPTGQEFDAMVVNKERLGVLVAAEQAAELAGPEGIPLEALAGLEWVSFPRADSPAWYDELTAILRSHGLDPGVQAPKGQRLIAEVKFAAVSAGRAFAMAPPDWSQPIPTGVAWSPLVGHPLLRRTWAVWSADSRRQDLGRLIAAFEQPAAG
ncbi:LysR family transcriptional regulator [Streptomyces melanosporofaciens]|uniref:DNA-binding transcriptional regulator, LysR family n=1 Tax=Streptomyces melanosporofaciens TaxID=67327 RepID=A0A1H4VW33_STRMJ|nr:LysR family transcriptional regulator [Streptomyces melanosporofaciens]SEC85309.1 DNA-binding transcriptional regulator, LysR family [Streptomyces melanosporofaciens]